ncbi:MAG: hypothetical protein JW798_15605 [Prolixibacteraceae bacterium]|nr:hypothetical protein [Prolixibacteraceae bacterium]
MEKFRDKYRIASARCPNWDYGSAAAYFVTICTRGRECYFGNVVNREMVLSEIGEIVETEWIKTFELRPDMNLKTGEYRVMPNHFHAIIIIGKNQYNCINKRVENQFAPQSKNLASIIRGFKSAVTVNARQINPAFGWQPRFHDHIIRDHGEYQRIARYIKNNPAKWDNDNFHI